MNQHQEAFQKWYDSLNTESYEQAEPELKKMQEALVEWLMVVEPLEAVRRFSAILDSYGEHGRTCWLSPKRKRGGQQVGYTQCHCRAGARSNRFGEWSKMAKAALNLQNMLQMEFEDNYYHECRKKELGQ